MSLRGPSSWLRKGHPRGAATSCLLSLAQMCHESQGTPHQLQCESNSLEIKLCIGRSGCSTLDLCQHPSEVATALCQPSTSGSGDGEMGRVGNPLKKCLCHMHSESLSGIMLQSSAALLVEEEQICHSRAIHLHMFQIAQGRITLQNMHDHSHVLGEHSRVWVPRVVSHCYLQYQGILLSGGLNHSYFGFQGHQGIRQPLD